MQANPELERGFTLLEVLAALAIAATGLLAVSQTLSTSIDVSTQTWNRTVAYWVAGNHMTELRLSGIWPALGQTSLESTMEGRNFRIARLIKTTDDADVVRVELGVSLDDESAHTLARLNGYLTRLEAPTKEANE